jgi:hypothetical protein
MPYIGKTTDGFGVRNRFVYLASADDTSVSGADANGATLTFTDGAYVDVYLNGVLLKTGTDYNTNTANTIAGLSAMSANDEVTVVVYDIFTVADMVSATSGGTFSGAVEFASGFTASDGSTITVDDNSDNLTLTSTDADANGGPNLRLYRNSSSPADGDMIGQIDFEGRNDNSQDIVAASIRSVIDDVSDGTEDSRLIFETITGGSQAEPLRFKPGETVFNESSADIDFRVESDGDANAFFLNAGTGNLTISNVSTNTNVESDIGVVHLIRNTSSTNDTGAMLCLGSNSNFGTGIYGQLINNSTNEHRLGFQVRNSSGSSGTRMDITGAGKVRIGSTNTAGRLNINFAHSASEVGIDIIPDGTTATMIQFKNSGGVVKGSITTGGSDTSYNETSDYRLKENVNYSWDATSKLKELKPAKFNWIDDETDTLIGGFLAHEVSSVVPEAVTGKKDEIRDIGVIKSKDGVVLTKDVPQTTHIKGKKETTDVYGNKVDALYDNDSTWTKTGTENVYQQIDKSKLVPLLVKTIQELEARVTALESK